MKLCNLEVDLGEWKITAVCQGELAVAAAKLYRNDWVEIKGSLKREKTRVKGVETITYYLQATELWPTLPTA